MKLAEKINKLKNEKNAVILVHNYQLPEVQDIADFVGDSLGLSIEAAKTKANVIIFCGVYFMAETAKIISPDKRVFIPDLNAGCPMADMITRKQLIELKRNHPGAKVLCYVNTPAEVKAECDVCCTSANSVQIARNAFKAEEEVIFAPDKYLARYTAICAKRDFIVWEGYCPIHSAISAKDIIKQKKLHPAAKVLVHPECKYEVIALADEVCSTEGMCKYIKKTEEKEFIIGTEQGIIHRLKKENPQKIFYPISEAAICHTMKLVTLEKVFDSLKELKYEIKLSDEIIQKSQKSIRSMLNFAN